MSSWCSTQQAMLFAASLRAHWQHEAIIYESLHHRNARALLKCVTAHSNARGPWDGFASHQQAGG